MEDRCKCQTNVEIDDVILAQEVTSFKVIEVNFDTVPINSKQYKPVQLEDCKSEEPTEFVIKRDPNVNQAYQVFHFKSYEGKIKPSTLKICYRPVIPFQKDQDTFVIIDGCKNVYKVIAKGESVGTLVKSSIKYLTFLSIKQASVKKTFNLQNVSIVPAIFKFDLEDNPSPFLIEPVKGIINPGQQVFINITFQPTVLGLYAKNITCLIWWHEPIILDILGYSSKTPLDNFSRMNYVTYPMKFEDKVGYNGFLIDSVYEKLHSPPVSMTKVYLDFGSVSTNQLNSGNGSDCSQQDFCLTNHTINEIKVVWDKDPSNVFRITPGAITVASNDSVLFECIFRPNVDFALFHRILTAQILWKITGKSSNTDNQLYETIPLTTSLRVIGHSFVENETWIANVEAVPPVIILPHCLPGYATNTTFKLEAKGHLPVLYKFLPPKETNIVIKPMVGCIRGFENIVAQVQVHLHSSQTYMEQWFVEFNCTSTERLPIYIKSECSLPTLVVGSNNGVSFGGVQPGCIEKITVPIKNTSSFQIHYSFDLEDNDYLDIDPKTGDIEGHEEKMVAVSYKGNLCAPKLTLILCKAQAVLNTGEYIGVPVEQRIKIFADSCHSQLCATPSNYSFGEVIRGTLISTEFYLFNFGLSPVNFKLVVTDYAKNIDDVSFIPNSGRVCPREKLKISVNGTAAGPGNHNIVVSYLNQVSEGSETVNCKIGVEVFTLTYSCVIPTLAIDSIIEHNYGYLFGKKFFWMTFYIDQLNGILNRLNPDSTEEVILYLPECEVGSKQYYIVLEISNISKFEHKVNLKRNKLCRCQLKEKSDNFTIRKKVFECPHRNLLEMDLTNSTICPENTENLIIKVKYEIPGKNILSYRLEMSYNRNLDLKFIVVALPKTVLRLTPEYNNYELRFSAVFIGNRQGIVQLFWVYNNTAQYVNYKVNIKEMEDLCKTDGFEVMKLLNPFGTVGPYSRAALCFRFHPIEAKDYSILIPAKFGQDAVKLKIKGKGVNEKRSVTVPTKVPEREILSFYWKLPIAFSVELLIFDQITTWSSTEKLIFIENKSNDKIFQYKWKRVFIENIIEITTAANSGLLKPKESHTVVVKIKSFYEAARLQLLLSCEILDYTQLILHQKSVEAYQLKEQQISDEFEITSSGVTKPKNNIQVIPAPEPLSVSLDLAIFILSESDIDKYMNSQLQMKQYPEDTLELDISNMNTKSTEHLNLQEKSTINQLSNETTQSQRLRNVQKPNEEDITEEKFLRKTVECLIANVIFSDYFHEILKQSNQVPPPFYCQFTMTKDDVKHGTSKTYLCPEEQIRLRNEKVTEFFTRPKSVQLANLVDQLIYDGIHECFKLGTRLETEENINTYVKESIRLCGENCKCKHKYANI